MSYFELTLRSNDSPPAHEAHQEQYDGDHEQNPNEVTQRVTADHPKQPKDDQNDRNCFEHVYPPQKQAP
jgi:hypothetical protein